MTLYTASCVSGEGVDPNKDLTCEVSRASCVTWVDGCRGGARLWRRPTKVGDPHSVGSRRGARKGELEGKGEASSEMETTEAEDETMVVKHVGLACAPRPSRGGKWPIPRPQHVQQALQLILSQHRSRHRRLREGPGHSVRGQHDP